jgi:hypothetical protein
MRDRRVKNEPAGSAPDSNSGVGGWVLVIATICAMWLVAMVVISHLGLQYKTPERIQNWKPDQTGRSGVGPGDQ